METTNKRRVDWFDVGREITDGNRARLLCYASWLDWQALPCSMSFTSGEAVKAIIRDRKIPNVLAVAESADLAPFGFLGVE